MYLIHSHQKNTAMSHPSKVNRIVDLKSSDQEHASGTTRTDEQVPHEQKQKTQPVVAIVQRKPSIMPVPTRVPYPNPRTPMEEAANICHRFTMMPEDPKGWVGPKNW